MSASNPTFIELQYQFAAHIRHPERHPKPAGIEERRMQIYRELFYNNIEGFISSGFPVLKSITEPADWHRMVRTFFDQYRCQTPYFLEIAGEFVTYIREHRAAEPEDYAFLQELVHYEWVELALDTSEAEFPVNGVDPGGDLLLGHPLQSPLAWSLMYCYPVHRICADYLPDAPSATPTCLVVYRDRADQVKFMAINPLTARLLYLLAEDAALTGQAALEQIAAEMGHPDTSLIVQGGLSTLQQLRDAQIILGTSAG